MTILWLFIASLSLSESRKLVSIKNDDLLEIVQEFTDAVASSYLSDARCVAVVSSGPTIQINIPELPVLNVAYDGNETHFDTRILTAINAGCLAFVIQTDDVKWMVEKISELTRSPRAIHRSNKRYIFLPKDVTDTDSSWETALDEAFRSRCMNWMADLLAVHFVAANAEKKLRAFKQISYEIDPDLVGKLDTKETVSIQNLQEDRYVLDIYTHRFVGANPSERLLLDIWLPGYGFVFGQRLFPNKVRNLMGKELTITSIPYPPFSVMQLDEDPPVYAGIDFYIWFEFTKKHNCKWDIVLDVKNWWGKIWENGIGDGLWGAVADDRVDVTLGCPYIFYREFLYTDFSVVYKRTGITVVAPRPKPLPGWLIPTQPFSPYMWYAVLASILVITFMLYILSKTSHALLGGIESSRYSTLAGCGFRAVELLVLQVPEDEKHHSTLRYSPMKHLVTWLILFFLVVSSAYGGSLSCILTLPQFQSPIDTIEDLAKSGIQWAALEPAFKTYLESSSNPLIQTLITRFIALPEEELIARAFDDIAFVIERLQGHYADVKYVFEEMMQGKRLMKEDLYSGYCVLAFRKGSPYRETVNDLIFRLGETGIVFYWEGMTVREFLSERRQQSVMQSRTMAEIEHTKLRLYHVQGPLYLLAMGLSVALVAVILEIVIFHHRKGKHD